MRTVTYKSVQDKANLLFAGKVSATDNDTVSLNRFINARYREYFESFFWPEWTVVEKRTFRQPYSSTTNYAASTLTTPTEVFYWPSLDYFQCLRPSLLTATSITRVTTTATVTIAAGHFLTTGAKFRVTIS